MKLSWRFETQASVGVVASVVSTIPSTAVDTSNTIAIGLTSTTISTTLLLTRKVVEDPGVKAVVEAARYTVFGCKPLISIFDVLASASCELKKKYREVGLLPSDLE